MHDLADMMEGWAQDPKCGAIDLGRLLGTADSLRAVAEVAGPSGSRPRGGGRRVMTAGSFDELRPAPGTRPSRNNRSAPDARPGVWWCAGGVGQNLKRVRCAVTSRTSS